MRPEMRWQTDSMVQRKLPTMQGNAMRTNGTQPRNQRHALECCMCVYLCESVYSSVHLCRYKCICRLLWITNGIEDGIWGKRAGRSSGRSAVFIHTHSHTHNRLYKLVCMVTAFIRIYLMRSWPEDRAQLWQPFSLQLWQIVAEDIDYTHTHTHRDYTHCWRVDALCLPLSLSLHCSI